MNQFNYKDIFNNSHVSISRAISLIENSDAIADKFYKDIYEMSNISIIVTWRPAKHLVVVFFIVLTGLISGNLLREYTDAVLPNADSITTIGALVATYMVAKKVLENWFYWFVIDAISVMLFIERELYLTALLFLIYLIIIIFGYRTWLKDYELQSKV